MRDYGAGSWKTWTFNTAPLPLTQSPYPDHLVGTVSMYTQGAGGTTLLEKDFTSVQSSGGQPYVQQVVTKYGSVSTTTNETLDIHGNLTQAQVTDYGGADADVQ